MPSPAPLRPVTAADVAAAVRVHADRMHDAVRRLGCAPPAAVEVVEQSALELVDAVAAQRARVGDLVGWWARRARALAERAATAPEDADLPLGGGLLSADADQQLLSEALEQLPARDRLALLLRDSYALRAEAVGAALGVGPDDAMGLVGRAREAFLPLVDEEPAPSLAGHAADRAALARLAEGGQVAARDATTRRHAQSCALCGGTLEAQRRAHLLLAGLTVVALPGPERQRLLARVDERARALLPASVPAAAASAAADDAYDDEADDGPDDRVLTPLRAMAGLAAAVAGGLVLGLLLADRGSPGTARTTALPPVTAPPVPVLTLSPRPTTTAGSASPTPAPTVFTLPPRTPSPDGPGTRPSTSRTTAPPTDPLAITLTPDSGPNGTVVTVSGSGWEPLSQVSLRYFDPLGRDTGSAVLVEADVRGRFTTEIAAQDPSNLPGRHEVRATDGSQSTAAPFEATA